MIFNFKEKFSAFRQFTWKDQHPIQYALLSGIVVMFALAGILFACIAIAV